MSYTLNPHLPKVRAKAVNMVRDGRGVREVSRYFGVFPSTVSRWVKKSSSGICGSCPNHLIKTQ
ncbi:helix-turn-helix domain-containing protein [Candidatus Peregrinibacteria bacterium]|nr:helix-turn-helix domain-containing protein [Candidatus Peregrinibacteria bacterium]MBT7703653.1 helix-turn-helix domain-containing protein [Candidatus Peregrinibacteria bacterium]